MSAWCGYCGGYLDANEQIRCAGQALIDLATELLAAKNEIARLRAALDQARASAVEIITEALGDG